MKRIENRNIKGDYYITDDGNVLDCNFKPLAKQLNACGYNYVMIEGKPFTIAYLVAKHYVDNPLRMLCVSHIDGNRANDNHSNLEWIIELEEEEEEERVFDYDDGYVYSKGFCPRPCYKVDKRGEIVEEFDDMKSAYEDYQAFNDDSFGYAAFLQRQRNGREIAGHWYIEKCDYSKERALEIVSKPIERKHNYSDTLKEQDERIALWQKEHKSEFEKKCDEIYKHKRKVEKVKVHKVDDGNRIIESYPSFTMAAKVNGLKISLPNFNQLIVDRKPIDGFWYISANIYSQTIINKLKAKYIESIRKSRRVVKPILKIDIKTNKVVKRYEGSGELAMDYNTPQRDMIMECLKGKRNDALGFRWDYSYFE